MTHYDLPHSATYSGIADAHPSINDLIGSSLRRAFPPLATEQETNERFAQLLDALGQRGSGHHQTAARAQQPQQQTLDDRILVAILVSTAVGGIGAMIGSAYGISLLVAFLS